MNELEKLKSKIPNIPIKPKIMAYRPYSEIPILEIIYGVNIIGNKKVNVCDTK